MDTERQEQGPQMHYGAQDQQAALNHPPEFQRVVKISRAIRTTCNLLGCIGLGYFAYLVIQSLSIQPPAEYEATIAATMGHAFASNILLLTVLFIPWFVMFIVVVGMIVERRMRRKVRQLM